VIVESWLSFCCCCTKLILGLCLTVTKLTTNWVSFCHTYYCAREWVIHSRVGMKKKATASSSPSAHIFILINSHTKGFAIASPSNLVAWQNELEGKQGNYAAWDALFGRAHLEFFLRHENILRCEQKNARRKYLNNDFFFS
jgi:hypothetical protein